MRVGDQVRARPIGGGVLGIGYQERARLGERACVPSGGERALAEDQVSVAPFADAQADPHVHLGADSVAAHRVLGRPLGRHDERHGDGAAAPGDRVGVLKCFGREFGVLIDQDLDGWLVRGGFPDSQAERGQLRGALVEPGGGLGEQRGCLGRRGGEFVQGFGPGFEFHASFHVDAPPLAVTAFGEPGGGDADDDGFPRAGRTRDQHMAAQERD